MRHLPTRFSSLYLRGRHVMFVALVVGPLAGVQAFNLWADRAKTIERAISDQGHFLQTALERFDDTVSDAHSTLDLLSKVPVIAEHQSIEACVAQLERVLPTRYWATNLHVIDATGHIVCSTLDLVRGMNVTDRLWFRETAAADHFLVSDVFINRSRRAPSVMAAVPFGATPAQGTRMMVAATIDTSWLKTLSARIDAREAFEILIVDDNGVVAAQFPDGDRLVGKDYSAEPLMKAVLAGGEGMFQGVGLDGAQRFARYARLPSTKLSLVVSLRTSSVLAVVNRNSAISIALFGVAALAGSVLVWLFGHWFFIHPFRLAETALARSEARFRLLTEESSDLILVIQTGAKRVYISPAVTSLLGYGVEDAHRTPISDLVHPEDLRKVARTYRRLSAGKPRDSATFRLRHWDGHHVWVEAAFCRLKQEGQAAETVVTVRNITERHRESEALRLASLSALKARAEADEANRAKTEFLACMSHEIRTPLNAVIGYAALLAEMESLPPDARRYSDRIQSGGNALLTIVNDILDFSQVEEGRLEIQREAFALPLLIDECLSMVQQTAVAKRLSLDVTMKSQLPPGVLGDENRLRQILLNLLNNAIKFTSEGSVVLEICRDAGPGAQRIRFSVVDTGMGIARDQLPRLFRRFEQGDGTNRRVYGGAGLGLVISKRLVELMGGEIGVTSEKGVGSTFWFVLDLPAAPLVLRTDRAAPLKLKTALNLLLAEDVPLNQELVCLVLEADGHTVDVVSNGAEAIMAVQNLPYDAVLMDIQMPHVDGLTATRAIRNLPDPYRAIPIIAMTASALPEQHRLAREAGMDDIIQKPFVAKRLYQVLDGVVGRPERKEDAGDACACAGADLDRPVLIKLIGLVGEAKTRALLATLATSLDGRFQGTAAAEGERAALRREAHSSVAGSGMLGFPRFAALCARLQASEDPAAFTALLVDVRSERDRLVRAAAAMAAQQSPLLIMLLAA